MAGQSQGAVSQLAINGQHMEFLTFRGGARHELVDDGANAIRGTYQHSKQRTKRGMVQTRMVITMQPSPAELDILIPLMGFTESPTDTFTHHNNALTKFPVIVDRVAKVHTYANCAIDKAIFRGQKGRKPIQLELHIVGRGSSAAAAGSFSATALDTDIAFAFFEASMTLLATSRAFDRFALQIDNKVNPEHNNSRVATSNERTDSEIILVTNTPYTSDEIDLYDTPDAFTAGQGGSLSFVSGGQQTVFEFGHLEPVDIEPAPILGKVEIRQPLAMKAFRDDVTPAADLAITHDATAA